MNAIKNKIVSLLLFTLWTVILFIVIAAVEFVLPVLLFGSDASLRLSFPAIVISAAGMKYLFSTIVLDKPKNQTTINILSLWLGAIVVDALLVWADLNPFYPKISIQFAFLIGLAAWWLVLSPLKKRKANAQKTISP